MRAYMTTKYITSKIDNKPYCKTNGHFARHLRTHGISYQEYYETYVTGKKEQCPFCSGYKTLTQANDQYSETCGAKDCFNKLLSQIKLSKTDNEKQATNEKRRQTNLKIHGVEFTGQRSDVIAKIKEANGRVDENGKTSKQIQQTKARATKKAKYGDEFYNNSDEIKVAKANHSDAVKACIQEKRIATTLEKYGVENILLLPEIRKKVNPANAKLKDFKLPSGKQIKIQGYEELALKDLLEDYSESDLLISDASGISSCGAPIFEYVNANRTHGKYYPDILIKSENKIIEVKSQWWYDGNGADKYKGRLENNRRKRQAAINAGYDFEFWVYDSKGNRAIIK